MLSWLDILSNNFSTPGLNITACHQITTSKCPFKWLLDRTKCQLKEVQFADVFNDEKTFIWTFWPVGSDNFVIDLTKCPHASQALY